jgi:predicted DNA-binding protein (UPF0251 family)
MSRSDPLLMLADIARLAFENPDLDEAVVRGIYQHQVLATGRQPTLRQAREYIGHLTSHLDDATIRVTLGLPPAARAVRETPAGPSVRTRRPGRGRPRGTGLLTVAIVRDACNALRSERAPRAVTQEALAERLEVSRRTLQGFLKANDLTWPIAD